MVDSFRQVPDSGRAAVASNRVNFAHGSDGGQPHLGIGDGALFPPGGPRARAEPTRARDDPEFVRNLNASTRSRRFGQPAAGFPDFGAGFDRGDPPGFGRKVGRNEPCPCGSGRKYRRCCGANRADIRGAWMAACQRRVDACRMRRAQPISTGRRLRPQFPGRASKIPAVGVPQTAQQPRASSRHSDSRCQSRPMVRAPQTWQ